MSFSLTYAFGRTGRHARKTVREARSFLGTKFRRLEPSLLRNHMFAQYNSIDSAIFHVMYCEIGDPIYPVHSRYAAILLDISACDFLRIVRLFARAITVQTLKDNAPLTKHQLAVSFDHMELIDFVYGGGEPHEEWLSLFMKPHDSLIYLDLVEGISRVLKMDSRKNMDLPDLGTFSNDWLSLIPSIHRSTNAYYCRPDWATLAEQWINGRDFGGPCGYGGPLL